MINEVISQLFAARDIAHAIHLRTRSFAQHVALGDFYEELVDLTDKLAESYAGRYGIVDVKRATQPAFFDGDAVSFIRSLEQWASAKVKEFNPADTYIINQWDEILTLVNRTKYKLENLA
jgi:hypothetical protein